MTVRGAREVKGTRRNRGAALVLVLWFVAGLTLLATSAVSTVQVDIRASAYAESQVRAAALGAAAIHWILWEIEANPALLDSAAIRRYTFEDHELEAAVRWDTGFVNLNTAAQTLLRDLLVILGGRGEGDADRLAEAIVDWRGPAGAVFADRQFGLGAAFLARAGRFHAPEDLLQVPGFDLPLYARIAPFVTVYGMSPRVNPRFAPLGVLLVLSGGNESVAERVFDAYRSGDAVVDISMLEQAYLETARGRYVRAEAALILDGARMILTRWVQRRPDLHRDPWLVLHEDLRAEAQSSARAVYGR